MTGWYSEEGWVGGARRPSITANYADRSCLRENNAIIDRPASVNVNAK